MNWIDARKLQEYLPKLSESEKEAVKRGKKIKVCEEQREGWLGKLPFYIFWCPSCENFAYDYAHGYIENQHLNCHRCGAYVDFRPWWLEWAQLWNLLRWKFGGGK